MHFTTFAEFVRNRRFHPSKGGIIIEDDVWIGSNCVVLEGDHPSGCRDRSALLGAWRGESIVEVPADVVRCFFFNEIDALALEDVILLK